MVLVDTNVILDVAQDDPDWADWSQHQLDAHRFHSRLAINGIVYAELAARYSSIESLDALLEATNLALAAMSRPALYLAGRVFLDYRRKGGQRSSVLPDFFIGAHAAVSGARLITRDPVLYRSYFPTVEVIAPQVN